MYFVVSFNIKYISEGDVVPLVYGNCDELGNGEPTNGIEFTKEPNSIYNYQAKIRFTKEIDEGTIWYSYCFRLPCGSIVTEKAPRRFLPQIHFNQNRPNKNSICSSFSLPLYDTIEEVSSIDDFILHFRVRCFTQYGQNLYICGSDQSLGNWDPNKAIQLIYEGNQDYWSVDVKLPLSNSPRIIEYKYFRSFAPKPKEAKSETQKDNSYTQHINVYGDQPKDFRSLNINNNTNNTFLNSRARNFQKTAETSTEKDTKEDDVDLKSIEWEPIDVPNHRIEIGPVTSPAVLEVADTFRWSDASQEILMQAPFVDAITARKDQNKANTKFEINCSKPDIVSVRFEALCPNITRQQDLYIIGSSPELGNWQISKGLKMDDSNFPLFIKTIEMKREKTKQNSNKEESNIAKEESNIAKEESNIAKEESNIAKEESNIAKEESNIAKEESNAAKEDEIKIEKENLFSFPFEYKFVIVGEELRDVEVEIDDDSPLREEELNKLEQMRLEEQQKKAKAGDTSQINDEDLIRAMNRKKKVLEKRIEKVEIWESSSNRYCQGITSSIVPDDYPSTILINSWYVNPNPALLKRFGISIPLFSVRSKDSLGIGQFSCIRHLVDFSKRIGSSLIQLPLPLFDTSTAVLQRALHNPDAEINESDVNPFNVVSTFALHPIYISLYDIFPSIPDSVREDIDRAKDELEKQSTIDYRSIYSIKMKLLLRIYHEVVKNKSSGFDDSTFDEFVEKEKDWLLPYSLLCFFREKYVSADFRNWPTEIGCAFEKVEDKDGFDMVVSNLSKLVDEETVGDGEFDFDLTFFLWLQYICYTQFNNAFVYAKKNNVALVGNLPLNVVFKSVDCWCCPSLFRHRDGDKKDWSCVTVAVSCEPDEAGATLRPIVNSDNFVRPSFDWTVGSLAISWLRNVSEHCQRMFDVLKIDPPNEICRRWEIDVRKSATACLGHFVPSQSITRADLDARNLCDISRYTMPHVRRGLLRYFFGEETAKVESVFFDFSSSSSSLDPAGELLMFKPGYDSERKLYDAFLAATEKQSDVVSGVSNEELFERLLKLVDDVLLIEDDSKPGSYFVRRNFFYEPAVALKSDISDRLQLIASPSYSELTKDEREAMDELYEYFAHSLEEAECLRIVQLKCEALQSRFSSPRCLFVIDDSIVMNCESLSREFREMFAQTWRSSGIIMQRPHDACDFFCVSCSRTRKEAAETGCELETRHALNNLNSPAILAVLSMKDLTEISPFAVSHDDMRGCECGSRIEECRVAYRLPFIIEDVVMNDELAEKLKKMCVESNRM